jgi:hypothetical protein
VHVFVTQIESDDPRLSQVWEKTVDGTGGVLIAGPDLDWLASPDGECMAVDSFDETDIATLRTVERETWDRWGVPQERVAHLDLARA